MRFFITMGGCTGFVLVLASSLHAGNAPAFALRDAGIGCVVAALLFRGAHRAFFASLQSHLRERAAALQQAASESTPSA
jgi:hypothetical protein